GALSIVIAREWGAGEATTRLWQVIEQEEGGGRANGEALRRAWVKSHLFSVCALIEQSKEEATPTPTPLELLCAVVHSKVIAGGRGRSQGLGVGVPPAGLSDIVIFYLAMTCLGSHGIPAPRTMGGNLKFRRLFILTRKFSE
ncbi:unnamed protein product, partial [Discosporangium mesarthrocarpum]